MPDGTKPVILLIEAEASLRRLIALGLQYRGMHVIEATSPASLLTTEVQRPNLLVLDVDGRGNSDLSLLAAVQTHPNLSIVPVVVLAWECPVPTAVQQDSLQARVLCLTKPFDARALYTRIEQMLVTSALPAPQEILLAAQAATPAPSIWPLVTAAGLLLAFIGLMAQLALTVLGLFIVIVALLCWTLGTKTKQAPLAWQRSIGGS